MASTNTEKPVTKNEMKKQSVDTSKLESKKDLIKTPINKEEKKENSANKEEKKETPKKKKVEVKKVKKTEVMVMGNDIHISTKVGAAICKMIRGKTIETAISELEEVQKLRKAVPMKGEIPHRKGPMMSGRFPVKAAGEFIRILKNLKGNVNQHDVEEPIITKAIVNIASRPLGKRGKVAKKRSHVEIWAMEKAKIKEMKKKKEKKE